MTRSLLLFSAVAFAQACEIPEQVPHSSPEWRIDAAPWEQDVDSHSKQMCVNGLGEIYVVWIDARDGSDGVWLNRSTDAGKRWMPSAVRIDHGGPHGVWSPVIACTASQVFVAWEDARDGRLQNHQIYFNQSSDHGESWMESDRLLELDPEGHSFSQDPTIAAVGSSVHVAWSDSLNGAADILVASSTNGGERWSAPVRVDSDVAGAAYSGRPRLITSGPDDVHVVWMDSRAGGSDIHYAVSRDGGAHFSPDQRLDGGDAPGSYDSFDPEIAADGDQIYAVWHDARNGEGRDVYLNYSANGGADWRASALRVDTDNPGFFTGRYPQVVAGNGRAHVAWEDERDQGWDIYLRSFEAGQPTGPEQRLDRGSWPGFANSTGVALVTRGDTVVAAWEDDRGATDPVHGYNDLYYTVVERSEVPEQDLRVDTFYEAQSYKTDLDIAVYGNQLLATWTDGRLGTADVWFTGLEFGTAAQVFEEEGRSSPAPE